MKVYVVEAADGLAGLSKAQELQPDLVILDIGLPELNGIEVARTILKSAPATKILFVSGQRSSDIVEEALRTGARGYVIKPDAGSELVAAHRAVLKGKRFISANLSARVISQQDLTMNAHVLLVENDQGLRIALADRLREEVCSAKTL